MTFLLLILWVTNGQSSVTALVERLNTENGNYKTPLLGWGASLVILAVIFTFMNNAVTYYLMMALGQEKGKGASSRPMTTSNPLGTYFCLFYFYVLF
jgi:hypothetical protein